MKYSTMHTSHYSREALMAVINIISVAEALLVIKLKRFSISVRIWLFKVLPGMFLIDVVLLFLHHKHMLDQKFLLLRQGLKGL